MNRMLEMIIILKPLLIVFLNELKEVVFRDMSPHCNPLKNKVNLQFMQNYNKNTKTFPKRAQRLSLNIPDESARMPDWKSDEPKIQKFLHERSDEERARANYHLQRPLCRHTRVHRCSHPHTHLRQKLYACTHAFMHTLRATHTLSEINSQCCRRTSVQYPAPHLGGQIV